MLVFWQDVVAVSATLLTVPLAARSLVCVRFCLRPALLIVIQSVGVFKGKEPSRISR